MILTLEDNPYRLCSNNINFFKDPTLSLELLSTGSSSSWLCSVYKDNPVTKLHCWCSYAKGVSGTIKWPKSWRKKKRPLQYPLSRKLPLIVCWYKIPLWIMKTDLSTRAYHESAYCLPLSWRSLEITVLHCDPNLLNYIKAAKLQCHCLCPGGTHQTNTGTTTRLFCCTIRYDSTENQARDVCQTCEYTVPLVSWLVD